VVKLFVSGFPLEITEIELAKLIAPYGDIGTLKIVRDKQTRKCKGYAFVEMLTEQGAANAAAALDGLPMEDRQLTVKLSEETPAAPPKHESFSPRPASSFSRNNDKPAAERPKLNDRESNSKFNAYLSLPFFAACGSCLK
jgi:RNA recognition motif-containing protein